ncbi:tetratricopeptide repeat protein [Phenylobacterium sp.]|uniref:tetratricopeptide repeat protein n=1 Tax=Phenylobacterium sp. TaxID=1871053 RepID=UPI00374D38F5
MFEAAVACRFGRGVPRDLAQSAYWYRRAAERGHPIAISMLIAAYRNGEGVPIDLAEAVRWEPSSSAMVWARTSRIVFPTPLKPTIKGYWIGRPRAHRFRATSVFLSTSARPASSGGGLPAPGAYGLRTGSMGRFSQLCENLPITR